MAFLRQAPCRFQAERHCRFNIERKTQAPLSPKLVWGVGPGVRGGVCAIGVEVDSDKEVAAWSMPIEPLHQTLPLTPDPLSPINRCVDAFEKNRRRSLNA